MLDNLRRVAVVSPKGSLILVIDGTYVTGVRDGFVEEIIPTEAIIAIEECPQDVTPLAILGEKPESPDEHLWWDLLGSDLHHPSH